MPPRGDVGAAPRAANGRTETCFPDIDHGQGNAPSYARIQRRSIGEGAAEKSYPDFAQSSGDVSPSRPASVHVLDQQPRVRGARDVPVIHRRWLGGRPLGERQQRMQRLVLFPPMPVSPPPFCRYFGRNLGARPANAP